MKFLTPAAVLVLLSLPAQAYQLHVRDNDSGALHQVESIRADTVVDFGTFEPLQTTLNTLLGVVEWGPSLEGMSESCILAPNNPEEANGKIAGSPTAPLTVKPRRDDLGIIYQYPRPGPDSHSYSYRGCDDIAAFHRDCNGEGNCAGRGDSSWAIVFDTPRDALCIELHLNSFNRATTGSAGERVHLEFWGEDGTLVGHHDVIDTLPVEAAGVEFCWESLAFISAVSLWPQNQIGFGITKILLGDAAFEPTPKTPEERLVDIENCLNTQTQLGCPFFLGNEAE